MSRLTPHNGNYWICVLLVAVTLIPLGAAAQDEEEENSFPLENFYAKIKKRPRSIFKNLKFGFSTGYGSTFVSNPLNGFGVYQPLGGQPSVFRTDSPPTSRYSNWINDMVPVSGALGAGSFLASSDTTSLGFKGSAWNLPFKATVHYEFEGKYRIGGGISYEMMNMGSLHATNYGDRISNFQPPNATGWMSKYFGMLGVSFYRLGDYLFTGDLQVGSYNPGSNFNSALMQTGVYYNLGVTVERELSEYLRVFVRPSYEIKSYTITVPEGGKSLDVYMNAFYLNVGISYSIPDLPKCYNADCRIQINHAHGNREYRSRVHPIYKKQNPQYGENHPRLIKYKGKNKKKLNPY